MASGGGHVAALWTEVNRCGQNGDFARALKAVNKSRCPGLNVHLFDTMIGLLEVVVIVVRAPITG